MSDTTIAAISTALATAGISVIRISGDRAIEVASKVFRSTKKIEDMQGYTCAFGAVYDNDVKIDECVATVFRAPHSYTGEDVVELSCHGGLYVTQRALRAVWDNGALPAEAGEFTKRAFLNGKIDLVEAEAVMDIISSKSENARRAALNVKQGALSKKINTQKEKLLSKAAHLNAWADYPEEDIPEINEDELISAFKDVIDTLDGIILGFDNGKALKNGINTVIAGKPNVGKSTLMNLLSGYDKSIVTSVAGTTRDVIEEEVIIDGVSLKLSDTAGLRLSDDEVERVGVDRAKERIAASSLVLCVFDASREFDEEDESALKAAENIPAIAIINKSDLEKKLDTEKISSCISEIVYMSAKTGEGKQELYETIKRVCGIVDFDTSEALLYNERQRALAIKAKESVSEALRAVRSSVTYDAVTVCAEEAIGYLCELTGENVSEEVVDRVFHTFCVGK